MGIGRPCGLFHLNPPPGSRYGERTVPAETPGEGIRWAREPGEVRVRRLDRPGPFLDHGLPAYLHRPVRERCRETVAAVVLAARVAVVPDADAHGTGHDAVLEESGQRLRVQSEPDPAEDVIRPGGLGPVRLRELHVLLRGEVRHLPVPERPREALDESTPLRD